MLMSDSRICFVFWGALEVGTEENPVPRGVEHVIMLHGPSDDPVQVPPPAPGNDAPSGPDR